MHRSDEQHTRPTTRSAQPCGRTLADACGPLILHESRSRPGAASIAGPALGQYQQPNRQARGLVRSGEKRVRFCGLPSPTHQLWDCAEFVIRCDTNTYRSGWCVPDATNRCPSSTRRAKAASDLVGSCFAGSNRGTRRHSRVERRVCVESTTAPRSAASRGTRRVGFRCRQSVPVFDPKGEGGCFNQPRPFVVRPLGRTTAPVGAVVWRGAFVSKALLRREARRVVAPGWHTSVCGRAVSGTLGVVPELGTKMRFLGSQ